jgi:hypothetical protein
MKKTIITIICLTSICAFAQTNSAVTTAVSTTTSTQTIIDPAKQQMIFNTWTVFAGIAAAALSALVHCYQIVVQAGGWKNIWMKFSYGSDVPTVMPEPKVKSQEVVPTVVPTVVTNLPETPAQPKV